jgi:hypothetical protein
MIPRHLSKATKADMHKSAVIAKSCGKFQPDGQVNSIKPGAKGRQAVTVEARDVKNNLTGCNRKRR